MKNEKERIARSGIFPNAEQTILLKACLMSRPDSIEAFNKWLQLANIPLAKRTDKSTLGLPQFFDKLDLGSQRLLSMLYQNMNSYKVKHPLIPKLEGYYKYVWYRNQVLMAEFRKLAAVLASEGIEVILRKGLYMTTMVYKDFGTRPTVDIDITVRQEKWMKTILVLESNGWKPKLKLRLNPHRMHLSHRHAFPYEKNDFQLDLHYDFINYPIKDQTKKQIWSKLNSIEEFNSISKSNEMYLTLLHGFRINIIPPIRWVADSVLLFSQFDEVDWDDFHKLLNHEKRKSIFLLLTYLQSNQFILYPERIQEQLKLLDNLKFDLYDRMILANNFTFFNGIIKCYAYNSISNPGSFRKFVKRWFDQQLWILNKKNYFEVILHALIRLPLVIFRLIRKFATIILKKTLKS